MTTMNNNIQAELGTQNSFCAKHCVRCQAGWVRATTAGKTVVICLLNREPVPGNLSACNKFQPEQEQI
jgi:hypothetical protein